MKDKKQELTGSEGKAKEVELIECQHQEEIKTEHFSKTIVATIFKTLFVLLVIVTYALAMLIYHYPTQAIKLYESVGANKIAVVAYERQYKRTGELSDLYNLIQKSASVQDHDKVIKYIEEIIKDENYEEFCEYVNLASISVAKLDRIAFVADLDSYLKAQLVTAYYYINRSKALSFAIEDLTQTDNIYSVSLSTFMSLVLNDKKLSEEQKVTKIEQIKDYSIQNKTTLELVDLRLALVDINTETSKVDKILMTYTSLKLNQIKYNIYKMTNEQDLANNVLAEINRLQEVYESLVN